ncbi:MAG: DUF4443 domain-containing protein [Candidatus Bathyarchaeia archaeon]
MYGDESNTGTALKQFLERLVEVKAPGPPLSFGVFHLFCALEFMSKGRIGRNRLAEQIAVGEGAIRTIVQRLVNAGLMGISRAGCVLTVEGLHIWRELERFFPKRVAFLRSELSGYDFNFAFLVRGCNSKVRSGIEQRDMAVAAGALCAVVVVFQDGRLRIESVSEDIEVAFPDAARLIHGHLDPKEGDVVVIAGGDTALSAKQGAFAASWSMLTVQRSKPVTGNLLIDVKR